MGNDRAGEIHHDLRALLAQVDWSVRIAQIHDDPAGTVGRAAKIDVANAARTTRRGTAARGCTTADAAGAAAAAACCAPPTMTTMLLPSTRV